MLLIGLPFVEVYLLFRVGGLIGFLPTLGLLLVAAAAGLSLMQRQGASILIRLQQAMARGELPAREVVNSGMAALAGVLLIIPGFVSDLLALACLMPASRRRLTDYILGKSLIVPPSMSGANGPATLEGEFRRED
jgi:UPF0716 protein FxsA